jgi:hypothetical protein
MRVFRELQERFGTGSAAERLEVVKALQSASSYESVSLLIHALDDADHDVRETARDILRALYPTHGPDEKLQWWLERMEKEDLP